MNNKASGFSLIELLIVIMILGIISAIAVPALENYLIRARFTEAVVFLEDRAKFLIRYHMENGSFPASIASGTIPTAETSYLDDWFDYGRWNGDQARINVRVKSSVAPNANLGNRELTMKVIFSDNNYIKSCGIWSDNGGPNTNDSNAPSFKYLPQNCRVNCFYSC